MNSLFRMRDVRPRRIAHDRGGSIRHPALYRSTMGLHRQLMADRMILRITTPPKPS